MTQMSVSTYSAQDVKVIIGGYTVVGWDNITIARRTSGFKTIPGIRGKHTRSSTRDTSATLTISLVQSSPTNDMFSNIHGLDLIQGTGRLELLVKDNSGRSLFSSNEGYIVGYPETTYAAEIELRTWTIFCQTTGSYVVGGNTKPETTIADALTGAVSNIF